MESKSINYDEELSNGESSKGANDTSLIVNVNDTHSDMEVNDQDNDYFSTDSEQDEAQDLRMKSNNVSKKKSPTKDSKSRSSKANVSETRYIWASGIPPGTQTSQLEEFFSTYGKVLAIKIIHGPAMTLLGFVKLETVEQAQRCMEKLNKAEFRGNRIELFKERPGDKEDWKSDKIGFRGRKFISPKSPMNRNVRGTGFRPRGHFRGGMKPISSRFPPRAMYDIQRHEQEGQMRIEQERRKLKLERMNLEREKAALMKLERESRYERERITENKRAPPPRPTIKRNVEGSFKEKRYSNDFNSRREEFPVRRGYQPRNSPIGGRKVNGPRPFSTQMSSRGGRYGNHTRQDRYAENKYDSGKNWQTSSDSWISNTGNGGASGSGNDRWNSNYDAPPPRMVASTITSSNPMPRMHSNSGGSEMSHQGGLRSYFNNRRYLH